MNSHTQKGTQQKLPQGEDNHSGQIAMVSSILAEFFKNALLLLMNRNALLLSDICGTLQDKVYNKLTLFVTST